MATVCSSGELVLWQVGLWTRLFSTQNTGEVTPSKAVVQSSKDGPIDLSDRFAGKLHSRGASRIEHVCQVRLY